MSKILEYKNIKKDFKKWNHVNVNVYKVKGNNLDQHGANAGSKLLQCYDPAVRTTNYGLLNFNCLWRYKTFYRLRRFICEDYAI